MPAESESPFLQSRVGFSTDTSSISPLPRVLQGLMDISLALRESGDRRLAIVLPRLPSGAFWISLTTVLQAMQAEFASHSLPPLKPGEKLLLDGSTRVVRFCGEETLQQQQVYRLQIAPGSWRFLPVAERLRLQPTDTRNEPGDPSPLGKAPDDLLDSLLGIQACGNRSLFSTSVILVSNVGIADASLRTLRAYDLCGHNNALRNASFEMLSRLVQCGRIRAQGHVDAISTGQRLAAPALLVAPDLIAVREYFQTSGTPRESSHPPLLVLDGVRTFSTHTDIFDSVLEGRQIPVLAIIAREDAGELKVLRERSFDVWSPSPEELGVILCAGQVEPGNTLPTARHINPDSPFSGIERPIHTFVTHRVETHLCKTPLIAETYREIRQLVHSLRDLPQVQEIEGQLFGCLLKFNRAVFPGTAPTSFVDALRNQCESVLMELQSQAMWLNEDAENQRMHVQTFFEKLIAEIAEGRSEKSKVLRKLLLFTRASQVAVVVPRGVDTDLLMQEWETTFPTPPGKTLTDRVRFVTCGGVFPDEFRQIIVAGWLGGDSMRQILDGSLARQVDVLLNDVERPWYESSRQRWDREFESTVHVSNPQDADGSSRIALVSGKNFSRGQVAFDDQLPTAPLIYPIPEKLEPVAVTDNAFDIDAIEVALRHTRRQASLNEGRVDEELLSAWLVTFDGGYFAYLRENHCLPVVTDHLRGGGGSDSEIPVRNLRDLHTGDYVVFREGTASNIIREVADRILSREGNRHLRQVSGMWREALRTFAGLDTEAEWLDENEVREKIARTVKALNDAGLNRLHGTIRNWLMNDDLIGPKDQDETIKIIVNVTSDKTLSRNAAKVAGAIRRVRGAHLEASSRIITWLNQEVAQHPEQLERQGGSLVLDMEEGMRVRVVRIVEIATQPEQILVSRVNLLWQDMEF